MRNQLRTYKQQGKEFHELKKDNHELKKVNYITPIIEESGKL
jgi:hypothetical protein